MVALSCKHDTHGSVSQIASARTRTHSHERTATHAHHTPATHHTHQLTLTHNKSRVTTSTAQRSVRCRSRALVLGKFLSGRAWAGRGAGGRWAGGARPTAACLAAGRLSVSSDAPHRASATSHTCHIGHRSSRTHLTCTCPWTWTCMSHISRRRGPPRVPRDRRPIARSEYSSERNMTARLRFS